MKNILRQTYDKPNLLISNYLYKSFESYKLDSSWKRISAGTPNIKKALVDFGISKRENIYTVGL